MTHPFTRYIIGDSLTVLRSLPDASVDLVLTSPPFLALRSYLPPDHPDKAKEMGSEPTPGEFIDALLDIVEECRRVLAPHGSIAFELGDTYSGSGGAGGDYGPDGLRAGQAKFDGSNHRRGRIIDHDSGRRNPGPGWPLDKSLCLIPELFRVALVYGFNPLTGRQTPRWRARNVVRWCRPNPPVGALGDKVRPATSDMVIACLGRRRYFDLDAVREPASPNTNARTAKGVEQRDNDCKTSPDGNRASLAIQHAHATAPPLDHWWHDEDTFHQDAWHIPTQPYKGSHYATWPQALCEKPIKAMCPEKVCAVCGKPSERIVEKSEDYAAERAAIKASDHGAPSDEAVGKAMGSEGARFIARESGFTAQYETTGWTDCGHDAWRPGLVLDPFAGSGTTLAVATGHGRSAIGIDLDERNADLAAARVGMWLEVEHHADEVVA